MRESQIAEFVTPILAHYGLDLDAVEVVPAGKRRLLRIVVDGDGPTGTGPLLDDIAEATRAVSAGLDETPVVGSAAYTLEVSSRGVSRPLELPRHWRRNVGRLVAVTTTAGEKLTGRVTSTTETSVLLDVEGTPREVALADVSKALVQVELNRPKNLLAAGEDETADEDEDPEHDDEIEDEN